ncbi:hypothetical protein [Guptibacillus algicola]|uniref:hypothetical protein n=1 Tax=Guptibacillus algicola TaxID=225844 RepID=UPI001CD2C2CD|nr:hypothetical protein [Alkalihalobacillus algicola]MCA0986507.1 hypothetical protein [Alkalihalobacillus algicola]
MSDIKITFAIKTANREYRFSQQDGNNDQAVKKLLKERLVNFECSLREEACKQYLKRKFGEEIANKLNVKIKQKAP